MNNQISLSAEQMETLFRKQMGNMPDALGTPYAQGKVTIQGKLKEYKKVGTLEYLTISFSDEPKE